MAAEADMTTLFERDDLKQRVSAQAYLHTAQAGAFVPLLQAAVTGLLIGLAMFAIFVKLRIDDAWLWGLIIFLLVTTGTWLLLQFHWFDLTRLERSSGVDLNRDGIVEQRTPGIARSVQVNIHEVTDNQHLRVVTARFPIDEARMAELAQGLLNGTPFTERQWSGNGKLLSLDEFRAIRSEMLKRGMLEMVNPRSPQQGYRLSKAGRAAMKELARMMPQDSPSPTPTDYPV
jgi:hypothetical protein